MSCSLTVYENRSKNQAIKTANSGIKLSAVLLCTSNKHQTYTWWGFLIDHYTAIERPHEQEPSWNATETTINYRKSKQRNVKQVKVKHCQHSATLSDSLFGALHLPK